MPWKECSVMDERLQFVARRLAGEPMTELCREFGISPKTGYKIFDRFYEKVIKVKADVAADVAALLDLFSDVRVTAQSSWERSATQFS